MTEVTAIVMGVPSVEYIYGKGITVRGNDDVKFFLERGTIILFLGLEDISLIISSVGITICVNYIKSLNVTKNTSCNVDLSLSVI